MTSNVRATRRTMVASLLAAALLLCGVGPGRSASAADDNAPGSVTGTVTDHAGQPAKKVSIKLFQLGGGGGGGGKGPAPKAPDPNKEAAGIDASIERNPVELQAKSRPVATTASDDAGKFQFDSLPPGTYRYMAGTPVTGYKGGSFKVEPSKQTTVTIQLDKPQPPQ